MTPFARLESDFRAQFAAMPAPLDPMAVDVTPETLGERDHVEAVNAYKAELRNPVRQDDEE